MRPIRPHRTIRFCREVSKHTLGLQYPHKTGAWLSSVLPADANSRISTKLVCRYKISSAGSLKGFCFAKYGRSASSPYCEYFVLNYSCVQKDGSSPTRPIVSSDSSTYLLLSRKKLKRTRTRNRSLSRPTDSAIRSRELLGTTWHTARTGSGSLEVSEIPSS